MLAVSRSKMLVAGSLSGLMFLACSLPAQSNYPLYDFKAPLEIPLYLAGNFAELRSNHFHGGIDIKTQGIEGHKVLASADGYVSRIKVSPYGYGRALYIRHPNGYTTVYGHLKKFNSEIEEYVKRNQYQKKSFKIELFPRASDFPVKQGEVIAISGNSGGSSAPHLHFEIRETAGEIPVNPLLFKFDIKDEIPPNLEELYVYPLDYHSEINGKKRRAKYSISGFQGNYQVNNAIRTSGDFGLGIRLFDRLNEMPNRCGIYEIKLFMQGQLIYHQKMEKIPFHENRYINALTDYAEKMESGRWIVRNFVLPNNKLNVYVTLSNRGVLNIPDGQNRQFRYEVTDSYGNLSRLHFTIEGSSPSPNEETLLTQKPSAKFKYNQANSFEREDVLVYLPANVLYEDLDFNFWKDEKLPKSLTPVYNIHNLSTPLHSYIALSIKASKIPQNLRKYCMIVSLDDDGGIVPEGGYWKGDYLIVKTRSFGGYTVMVDSTPPRLTPLNISNGSNMKSKWSIMVKAEDNLSGVTKYDAFIDGKWILTEFDYKAKRLIHYFESDLSSGEHTFRLIVKDKIGNQTEYETRFFR